MNLSSVACACACQLLVNFTNIEHNDKDNTNILGHSGLQPNEMGDSISRGEKWTGWAAIGGFPIEIKTKIRYHIFFLLS